MDFLRRLGGKAKSDVEEPVPFDAAEIEAEERQRDLDLLQGEEERLDELAQRQLRYERHAWQPPAQGGERRADDREDRDT